MHIMLAAILATAGVMLGAVNIWQNTVAINGGIAAWNDLSAFVAALSILSAIASLVAGTVRHRWPVATLTGLLIVAGCTITSVHYTLTRIGGQADTSAQSALEHNARLARAEERVANLRAEAKAEAARGGCGRKCRELLETVKAAQEAADAFGAPRVVDPAAERIEAATGGLWASNHYRVALPVIQAVTIEAGVAWLLFMAGQFFGLRRPEKVRVEVLEPIDPIVRALELAGGRAGSNNELAELVRLPAPRVTERVKLLETQGVLTTYRVGKNKIIELA